MLLIEGHFRSYHNKSQRGKVTISINGDKLSPIMPAKIKLHDDDLFESFEATAIYMNHANHKYLYIAQGGIIFELASYSNRPWHGHYIADQDFGAIYDLQMIMSPDMAYEMGLSMPSPVQILFPPKPSRKRRRAETFASMKDII